MDSILIQEVYPNLITIIVDSMESWVFGRTGVCIEGSLGFCTEDLVVSKVVEVLL